MLHRKKLQLKETHDLKFTFKKERNPFRCYFCGKFFSYKEDFYVWTPYGGYEDIDPPDDERAHKNCFEKYDASGKDLIYRTSWIKPTLSEWSKNYET